jgi:hypothetical protein
MYAVCSHWVLASTKYVAASSGRVLGWWCWATALYCSRGTAKQAASPCVVGCSTCMCWQEVCADFLCAWNKPKWHCLVPHSRCLCGPPQVLSLGHAAAGVYTFYLTQGMRHLLQELSHQKPRALQGPFVWGFTCRPSYGFAGWGFHVCHWTMLSRANGQGPLPMCASHLCS